MATRAEVNAIINTNLTTTSNPITAFEHRTVEKAVLDYTAGRIIARNFFSIGDVNGNVQSRWTVPLGQILLNSNYIIIGHITSYGGDYSDDNDVNWCITNKTNSNFEVFVGEFTTDTQGVAFDWIAISTQDVVLTTTV